MLVFGEAGRGFEGLGDASWYYAVGGGLVGAAYVTTVVVTVSSLGAAGVVAATIAGQLAASVVLDRLGALGLEQVAISSARIAGVVCLLLGTYLVVR